MNSKINILDKGYVRLVDTLGNDLSVANAARVSYDKESKLREDGSLNINDQRLIKFLWNERHTSPFRHAAMTFEVYAPLFVARQWWKHAVASTHLDDQNGWNESSRRYITENEEFYVPKANEWRSKPENSKQGSGEPIMDGKGQYFSMALENYIKDEITRNLAEEKLDGSITITQVMIRNVVPSDTVVASANDLVRSKNELKQKEVEVKTAEAESRRMAALANNSGSSIAFMQAQAMLNISEGIKAGKVQTIVVPSNFNALMMPK
jgi:thymidylate synthase (FAD)